MVHLEDSAYCHGYCSEQSRCSGQVLGLVCSFCVVGKEMEWKKKSEEAVLVCSVCRGKG